MRSIFLFLCGKLSLCGRDAVENKTADNKLDKQTECCLNYRNAKYSVGISAAKKIFVVKVGNNADDQYTKGKADSVKHKQDGCTRHVFERRQKPMKHEKTLLFDKIT